MRPPDYCLLGRKKKGVVTDGLVSWIDGQDYFSATSMVDRISGLEIKLSNAQGTVTISQDNDKNTNIMSNSHTKSYMDNQLNIISPKAMEFTGIILSGATGFGCWYPVSTGRKSALGLGYGNDFYPNIRVAAAGEGLAQENISLNEPCNIILSENNGRCKFYINGELFSEFYYTIADESKYLLTLIGYGGFNGSFGCLRYYNRPLTEEEIKKNYDYEKSLGRVE